MSVHLSNNSKTTRSPCTFVQIPPPSSSPPSSSSASLPPLLDAALMTVVQQQQQQSSRTPPPGFDRNQFEHILINFSGVRSSMSPNSTPKTSKTGTNANSTSIPPAPPPPLQPLPSLSSSSSSSTHCPPPNQHHLPLLTAHSFLYNPVEPCIFPIAIPPGFSSASPDFMRLFAPNMAAVAAAAATNPSNSSATGFVPHSTLQQGSRSTSQSNGTSTPPEPTGGNLSHQPSVSSSSSSTTNHRHQQSHYRQRQYYPNDPHQFQQNTNNHFHSQRQSQNSYPQQQHNRPKACYTCGDLGHLAFACPEQYSSDSNYSHTTRGVISSLFSSSKQLSPFFSRFR